MFKKLLKEIIEAKTLEEVNNIFYREDGVDMSYQHEKLSYKDYEILEKLVQKLNDLM